MPIMDHLYARIPNMFLLYLVAVVLYAAVQTFGFIA
jgi:hypothetical protein